MPGVRSRPWARSTTPPYGSTNCRDGSRTAIAFTVKSRRRRSPSRESPKSTAGLREEASYTSERYVVISTWKSPLRLPMVPKARPMSQVASAQPTSSRSISSGRADVVRSRSLCRRPSIASRTGPPTSASSCPAAAKRVPSSSITGPIRSSSAATSRWASASRTLPGGRRSAASGTEQHPSGERRARIAQAGAAGPALQSGRAPPVVAVARPGRAGRGGAGAARRAGSRLDRAHRRRGVRRERPAAGPGPAADAADALDHPGLHPRQGPDRHHRHGHQRLRGGVDGDQRRGVRRLAADHDHRRARRRRRDPRQRRRRSPDRRAGDLRHHRLPADPARPWSSPSRLPRSKLAVSAPGVYWFGVHALGTASAGRITAGRDRTFLPLVPPAVADSGQVEQTSLVLPVRARRHPWSRRSRSTTSTGGCTACGSGALHDVVATGRAARGRPLTWVVDPAVVDAVRRLAEGNPPRTLVAPAPRNPDDTPSPDPSAGASASGSADSASDDSVADPLGGGRRSPTGGCASCTASCRPPPAR